MQIDFSHRQSWCLDTGYGLGKSLLIRSSGAPTACHRARATVQVCIFCSAGPASHRRRPLTSNVRPPIFRPAASTWITHSLWRTHQTRVVACRACVEFGLRRRWRAVKSKCLVSSLLRPCWPSPSRLRQPTPVAAGARDAPQNVRASLGLTVALGGLTLLQGLPGASSSGE